MTYELQLKQLREARAISEQEIAQLLDVSLDEYADIEADVEPLFFNEALLIADYLRVPLDVLAGRSTYG
ncbi:MAG: helix-turn-helix transcriptional regulator [Bacteroidaceae bacterium]|nr:helix-turn-helix transcriptional regulator [Bacteroidaceae bacterium]